VGDRDHPATLSFLGYDQGSGQLIHLHLHFRLVIGERLLKNYRIPWEEVLLNGPFSTLHCRSEFLSRRARRSVGGAGLS
jgi:hypothetical protein